MGAGALGVSAPLAVLSNPILLREDGDDLRFTCLQLDAREQPGRPERLGRGGSLGAEGGTLWARPLGEEVWLHKSYHNLARRLGWRECREAERPVGGEGKNKQTKSDGLHSPRKATVSTRIQTVAVQGVTSGQILGVFRKQSCWHLQT